MKNKVIEILKELSNAVRYYIVGGESELECINNAFTRIDFLYSGDMKQCMYCEKTVEYSSGVFACEECSGKQPERVSEAQQLINDIADWSDSTFGEAQRNPAILHHLAKEVSELIEAIQKFQNENSTVHPTKSDRLLEDVLFEYADCFMLLMDSVSHMGFNLDTILEFTGRKLEINKQREWGKPDEKGVIEHILIPEKQSAKSAHTISEGEINDAYVKWVENSSTPLTRRMAWGEAVKWALSNGSQSAIGEELIGTLRFTLSQLNSYHEIANDPGTTDCILKVKAAIKQLNKKS